MTKVLETVNKGELGAGGNTVVIGEEGWAENDRRDGERGTGAHSAEYVNSGKIGSTRETAKCLAKYARLNGQP